VQKEFKGPIRKRVKKGVEFQQRRKGRPKRKDDRSRSTPRRAQTPEKPTKKVILERTAFKAGVGDRNNTWTVKGRVFGNCVRSAGTFGHQTGAQEGAEKAGC